MSMNTPLNTPLTTTNTGTYSAPRELGPDGRVQRRVQPREVRGDGDGMRERHILSYRVDEDLDMLPSRAPLRSIESGLLRDGFSVPGLAHIYPTEGVALHAAFAGAGMELHDLTLERDERTQKWTYTVDFTVFRTTIIRGVPATADAVALLGESARAATTSLEAEGRPFRSFSEQLQNGILAQRRAVWERMGLPRPGLIRMPEEEIRAFERAVVADNYSHAPAAAPANPPAPKPAEVISPFSIGLGQRSIEI